MRKIFVGLQSTALKVAAALLLLVQLGCTGEVTVTNSVCDSCPDRCVQTEDKKSRCVTCLTDKQCRSIPGSTKVCTSDNRCICGSNVDCPAGLVCAGEQGCLECLSDANCNSADRPYCGQGNRCVRCTSGSVRSCSPPGTEKICNKGIQTCSTTGLWGECKGLLVCKEGESCSNGRCVPDCPELSACQLGEKSCISGPDDPGEYTVCVRNEKGCLEVSKEVQSCPGTQICRNGQCLPPTCSNSTCKVGETQCTDSKNVRTCALGSNGCPTWEASKPCPDSQSCSVDLSRCVVCLPGSTRPCYRGPEGTKDVGLCKSGTQTCNQDGNGWGACVGDVLPTKEACNDKDDNCNGQADEGCKCTNGTSRPCGSSVGACKEGTQTCQKGLWGNCVGQVLPTTEVCNGIDDNCDGKVDEAYSTLGQACSTGVGECSVTGKWVCGKDEKSVVCDAQAKPPSKELCDGLDNDCNGKVDDNLTPEPCGKQDGVCKGSYKKCGGVSGWISCGPGDYLTHASTYEEKETNCDGLDNDCDGTTDANLTQSCYGGDPGTEGKGLCKAGTQTCTAGKWGACQGEVKPSAEVCDGKDNDCNGSVDEGIAPKPCYTGPAGTEGKGRCKAGAQVCQNGKFGACAGEVLPLPSETCNNIDDNCNGSVDENVTQSCYTGASGTSGKGLCKAGTQTCSAGKFGACVGEVKPTTETCDNKDNDCDGQIDNGVTKSCYNGPAGTQNKGICKSGTQTCTAGTFGACVGEVKPDSTEACDTKDNDCDGQIDEGCACVDNTVRDCGTDEGECKKGKQTCSSGQWGACVGEVKPTAEVCDGKDNDCNGKVDESWTTLGKSCSMGLGECQRTGKWVCKTDMSDVECDAQPGAKQTETCDNKDNDCDGQIDNGVTKSCYSGPTGTEGKGICKAGTQTCSAGTFGACVGEVKPQSSEVCDNKDNDCNGMVDEGLTRACYTGAAGTEGKGTCKGGTQTCSAGKWGTCAGQVVPVKEKCDKKDDDCDGQVDEGDTCAVMYHHYGPSGARARGIAIDAQNNFYFVGFFTQTLNIGPSVQMTSKGQSDGYVAKFNSKGEYLWHRQLGGTAQDTAVRVRLDSRGNVYVAGRFEDKVTFGSKTLTSAGKADGFLTKLDPTGKFLWTTQVKSAESTNISGFGFDRNDNVFITGTFTGSATFGATQLTSSGGSDVYLSKLNPTNGSWSWSKQFGGGAPTTSSQLDVSSKNGNIFLAGKYKGTTTFGSKKMTSYSSGRNLDGFFVMFNSSGTVQWAKSIGGIFDDGGGKAVLTDGNGNVYLTAIVSGSFTIGSTRFSSGFDDGYLLKFDATGALLWGKLADAPFNQGMTGIALDKTGNIYVSGFFSSSMSVGGTTLRSAGREDMCVLSWKPDGTYIKGWRAGGYGEEYAHGIAVAPSGKVYVAGDFATNYGRAVTFGARSHTAVANNDNVIWEIIP
ncbi:MAG: hypothetical protein EP343_34510 [Deltaproteobacteria bacterium]|nr:MAG: hypothetical protein EP343_34510 [Deltaproteobacteria bacterium]